MQWPVVSNYLLLYHSCVENKAFLLIDQSQLLPCYNKIIKQAGAELGQAQVKLNDIVVIVVEVVAKAMVEVEVQLLFLVGIVVIFFSTFVHKFCSPFLFIIFVHNSRSKP